MLREAGGGIDRLAGSMETSVVPTGSAWRPFAEPEDEAEDAKKPLVGLMDGEAKEKEWEAVREVESLFAEDRR